MAIAPADLPGLVLLFFLYQSNDFAVFWLVLLVLLFDVVPVQGFRYVLVSYVGTSPLLFYVFDWFA